jgi:hypothetical protein
LEVVVIVSFMLSVLTISLCSKRFRSKGLGRTRKTG